VIVLAVLNLLAVVLLLAVVFFLVRNEFVCHVGCVFIAAPDFPRSYRRLPDYDAMLYEPGHWGRWTPRQWRAWLATQPEAPSAAPV
jgi:hypothetical protein